MRLNGTPVTAQSRRGGTAGRPWMLWGAALALIALAAWLTYDQIQKATPQVTVVVAAREIPANTVIQPGDLKLDLRPASGLPGDAVKTTGEVTGKLARGHLLAGDVIRTNHAVARSGGPLSAIVDQHTDRVLVSLSADVGEGLFSKLAPGDLVDVLGVLQIQSPQVNEMRIGVLAAAVPVVVVERPESGSGLSSSGGGTGSFLVAVTQKEAQAIQLSKAVGKVFVQATNAEASDNLPPIATPALILPSSTDQSTQTTKEK